MGGALPVQNVHQTVADGRAQEAPDRMGDGIPMGIAHVIAFQLAQDLTGKNVDQDHDLQPGGKGNFQPSGDQGWEEKKRQHQQTDEYVLPQTVYGGTNQHQQHQQTQHRPGEESRPVILPLPLQGLFCRSRLFHGGSYSFPSDCKNYT